MKKSCIVIVGKPGAGKSSIGSELAQLIEGTYLSLGGFMREVMHLPDPHIGIDKNVVYKRLREYLDQKKELNTLVLDCHPYPAEDLEALQSFVGRPEVKLRAVIYVVADDEVALKRLRRRTRPGQTDEERLAYFNDNRLFIEKLLATSSAMYALRIENNMDFDDDSGLKAIAEQIARSI